MLFLMMMPMSPNSHNISVQELARMFNKSEQQVLEKLEEVRVIGCVTTRNDLTEARGCLLADAKDLRYDGAPHADWIVISRFLALGSLRSRAPRTCRAFFTCSSLCIIKD